MTTPRIGRRLETGFTLIELMIALVVLGFIMGAAVTVFRSQSANFRFGGQRLELSQNLRYALGTMDRVLRSTGSGTQSNQPMFVYGDGVTVAVNANYTDSVSTGTNTGVYVNPDAPPGSFTVLQQAFAFVLPNTAFTYPSATYNDPNGTPGDAETVIFYVQLDATTADPLDYALMQQTNNLPAELVSRNIYPYPGRPFFEYYVDYYVAPTSSLVLSTTVPGMIPIRHVLAQHGGAGDVAGSASAVADSVKAVRVNFRITNGVTGAGQRTQDISEVIRMPNNGLIQLKTCGSVPLFSGPINVAPTTVAVATGVQLADTVTWTASFDETSGEKDVQQYNIYRKLSAAPSYGPPILTQKGLGTATYTRVDAAGLVAGTPYDYEVTAGDCTPSESPPITAVNNIPQ